MNKRILLLTAILFFIFMGRSAAQFTPIFTYADERLSNTDGSKIKFLKITRQSDVQNAIDRAMHNDNKIKADNLTKKTTNSSAATNTYFFLSRGALSVANTDSLNKYLYNQNQFDVLQSTSIQNFANTKTYISSELASAYFGPVRVGFNGGFLTTGDTSKDNAIKSNVQKIITSGGQFSLSSLFPLLFLRNKTDAYHLGLFMQQNVGLLPGIDSTGKASYSGTDAHFAGQTGLLLHLDAGSATAATVAVSSVTFRLAGDISCYYVYGNYNQVLNLPDFSVINLRMSCVIGDLVNFSASGPLFCTQKSVQAIPFNISLQFSPSQVAQAASNGSSSTMQNGEQ